jgi:two-component system, cell cycle response regulator DivK
VLVVDDNEEAAEMLAHLLHSSLGCEVSTAYDGADALDKAGAVHPDVVVMDVTMPLVDGIEAAGLLRRVFRDKRPRLIALTGRAHELAAQEADTGFDIVLAKPVSFQQLLDVVCQGTLRQAA